MFRNGAHLAFFSLCLIVGIFLFFQKTLAATVTWDGGGATNNWSEAENWSSDTIPVSGDLVVFNGTSTKASTIDQTFSISELNINAGYTNTITQAANLTISGNADFVHNTTDGTFVWSSGTLTFANNTGTSWDIDTDDVFGHVTIDKGGNPVTIVSGDTAIVTGTLTLTDGTITTGTLEARGDVVHGAGFDGGTLGGTLNITQGASAVTLTGGGQLPITTLSANRTINGPTSGTVTFDGLFTMSAGSYVGGAGDLTLSGGLTVSGGSFNGGSGNIDNNGTFVLSGVGTSFTSSTGTFFVASNWTHTDASTFTHNSGTVTFDGGATTTIDVNTTETFNNVTINTSSALSKNVASGDTIIVTGTLTLVDGNIGGTVEARSDVTHGAAFDGGTGTLNITQGSADINLTAGGQMPATALSANRIMNGPASGTVSFDATLAVSNGSFVGSAGNVTLVSLTLSSPGSFTAPSGTLTVSQLWTHTDSSTFNHNSGTVVFSGATALVNFNTSETFNNATISKSANNGLTIANGDTLIVSGTLNLNTGSVNNTNATLEARGDVVHGASFEGGTINFAITQGTNAINLTSGGQLPGTTLSANRIINGPASGTVTFDGSVTVSNGSLVGVAGNFDIDGSFTLSSPGSVTAPSGNLNVSGNWTHLNGTFNANSGTVILDGTNQTMSGATTFNNFTKSASSSATLTFPSSTTQTFTGTLTLNGFSTSQRLSLVSSSPGTQAKIDPQGTRVIEYLQVQDNDNDSLTEMSCLVGCLDNGNNQYWRFGARHTSDWIDIQPATLTVTQPNTAGFVYNAGQEIILTWESSGHVMSFVTIEFSSDNGQTFTPIVSMIKNTGIYPYILPTTATTEGRFLVKGSDGVVTVASDMNDESFVIVVPEGTPDYELPVPGQFAKTPKSEWIFSAGEYVRTESSSTVYLLEEDVVKGVLVRRPFIDAQTYFTYESSFEQVRIVSELDLSGNTLPGDVMLPNSGVVLVKQIANSEVYLIEQQGGNHFLRWLVSEELAAYIFGLDWHDFVIDLNPIIWPVLEFGEPILNPLKVDTSLMKKRFELNLQRVDGSAE